MSRLNKAAWYNQRWGRFFLILIALLASIEAFLRTHEAAVLALQDGVLLKMQMFETRGETGMLFLGTSRTQDGIDPKLIADEMGALRPSWQGLRAFNAAAAGGSLDRLAYCVDKALAKPGLKYIGLEVSAVQLSDHHGWRPDALPDKAPENFEEHLQAALADYSYVVRYRKAFRIENIPKYPLLMFPDFSDGMRGFGQAGGVAQTQAGPQGGAPADWNFEPLPQDGRGPLLAGGETFVEAYRRMADRARAHGVRLFLYVPPVRGPKVQDECDPKHLRTYRAIAEAARSPLLGYACTDAPAEYFADDGHLNAAGKLLWSRRLAKDMATALDGGKGDHAL